MTQQRLPAVNGDDGAWGDILNQYLSKEHYDDGTGLGNALNGMHKTITVRAGSGTAGTAPIKLTSGAVLSTTEAGAIEYDGTHLYYTATNGGTRYQLDQQVTGITRVVTSISSPTTAGATALTDYVYLVSGVTTITLPTAVGNTNTYTIINTGASTVTVATTSSQTINGSSSATLPLTNMSLDFVSNNANWAIQ